MKSYGRFLFASFIFFASMAWAAEPLPERGASDPIHVGILSFRPKPETTKRWQPVIEYLNSQSLGRQVALTAYTYPELEAAVQGRQVDLVVTQPAHYMLLAYREGLYSPLATLVERQGDVTISSFGGVIVTRANRADITRLSDLKGKRVALSQKESLGAYVAQAIELTEVGIDPGSDVQLIEVGMPHDKAVDALLKDQADVAFVRTGLLEAMAKEGKIDMAQMKVMPPPKPQQYPYLTSTRLYPEWAVAAMPWMDGEVSRKVAASLLSLPHGGEVARAAAIQGFTIPGDYHVVEKALQTLHLPPFERKEGEALVDFLELYRNHLLFGSLIASLLPLLLWIALRRSHRRLNTEHEKLVQTSEALLANSARTEAILNSLGEGVYGMDSNGIVTFINPAALSMLGYTEGELLGKNGHDAFHHHHEDGSDYDFKECPVYLSAHDGQKRIVEDWFWMKGGQRGIPVRLTTTPQMKDGTLIGCVTVFSDISTQRENEITRKNHQERLESEIALRTGQLKAASDNMALLIREAPIGQALIALDGKFLEANPALCRLLGYSAEELVARRVRDITHPDDLDLGKERYQGLLSGKMSTLQFEKRLVHRDGHFVWIEAIVVLVRDETSAPAYYIAQLQDITQRKELADALHVAKDKAESASRAKSAFLAAMSHEIRTPLNGVLGLAQIGYRECIGRIKAQTVFDQILQSGRLLQTIINDILDFSKIEAGKLDVEEIPIDPGQILAEVSTTMKAAAEHKGLRFEVTQENIPNVCLGDPVRISQVLLNLLSNAVKFTPAGHVRLHAHRQDDSLMWEISDSGIGLSPEEITRLFRPFEQADSSTTRRYGGTGLGLTISKRLVELMGGTLEIASTQGEGSTFTFRMPIRETTLQVNSPIRSRAAGENRLSGLRILLAEDNSVNQMVMLDFLQHEGAEVRIVSNGLQAVEEVRQAESTFDVVLMDIQMPEMDGLEATRIIRATHPELPIIGQTAHALKEEHDKCIAAGMLASITKPIDVDVLVQTIISQLGRKPQPLTITSEFESDLESAPTTGEIDWPAVFKRYRQRQAFVEKLAATVLETHTDDPATFCDLVETKNIEELKHLVHAWKGIAGNFEAKRLEAMCLKAMLLLSDDMKAGLAIASQIQSSVEELLHELRNVPHAQ